MVMELPPTPGALTETMLNRGSDEARRLKEGRCFIIFFQTNEQARRFT